MRIAHYPLHARQIRDFLGRSLRVAAGHQDLAFGIFTIDPANGGTRILVGRSRHRARVQDDDARFLAFGSPLQPALAELPFHSRAIGLGRAAAKILYIKTSHPNIVVQESGLCAARTGLRLFGTPRTFASSQL